MGRREFELRQRGKRDLRMKKALLACVVMVALGGACAVERDSEAPTVSVVASDEEITVDDVGVHAFKVTARFSEVMDSSKIPTAVFEPELSSTLTNPTGAWGGGDTFHTWTYDVEASGVSVDNVDVRVDGGRDLAGNDQVAGVRYDCIDVDTTEPAAVERTTLRGLADDLNIYWGTSIWLYGMKDGLGMSDAVYVKTISQEFNLAVPDYGMYMSDIQPLQGMWDFSGADRIVDYAETHDMRIRGHALVWGRRYSTIGTVGGDWTATPAWVHNGDFSRAEMIEIMNEYIETVVRHYGDRVDEWVVVNESASWEPGGGFGDNVWKEKLGEDYVELAFRKAREVAPNAVLILNEYGGDYLHQTTFGMEDNIYRHVKRLVKRGVPIDAVGLQFHLAIPPEPWENPPTVERTVGNFERFGDLGLDVYVTELDVKIQEPITQEKLDRQAEIYAMVMEAVLESDDCNSVCVWGYSDRYSWIPGWFPGYSGACMFDKFIEPKPAYYSVVEAMQRYLE